MNTETIPLAALVLVAGVLATVFSSRLSRMSNRSQGRGEAPTRGQRRLALLALPVAIVVAVVILFIPGN